MASLIPHPTRNACATNIVVSLYTGGQIRKEIPRMTSNLIGEKEQVDLFNVNWNYMIGNARTFIAYIQLVKCVVTSTLQCRRDIVLELVQGITADVLTEHYGNKLITMVSSAFFHDFEMQFRRCLFEWSPHLDRSSLMDEPFVEQSITSYNEEIQRHIPRTKKILELRLQADTQRLERFATLELGEIQMHNQMKSVTPAPKKSLIKKV